MGRAFAVHPLDSALMRRFASQIDFDFLGEKEEVELVMERTGLEETWAKVLVKVANQVRGLWRTGGEVVEALDTASLLVWAEELAAELADGVDGKEALLYTARFTWLPRVAGRDHLGRINEGNAGGLEMVMEDVFDAQRPGGGP